MTASRPWLIHHYAACRFLTINGGCSDLVEIVAILRDLEESCARDKSVAARAVRDLCAVVKIALSAIQLIAGSGGR